MACHVHVTSSGCCRHIAGCKCCQRMRAQCPCRPSHPCGSPKQARVSLTVASAIWCQNNACEWGGQLSRKGVTARYDQVCAAGACCRHMNCTSSACSGPATELSVPCLCPACACLMVRHSPGAPRSSCAHAFCMRQHAAVMHGAPRAWSSGCSTRT